MVATKFLIELVVIIVALAVALWFLYSNYQSITTQFFDFLQTVPLFATGG